MPLTTYEDDCRIRSLARFFARSINAINAAGSSLASRSIPSIKKVAIRPKCSLYASDCSANLNQYIRNRR